MKNRDIIREQILEAVKNQMAANNPPEVNLTYKRLRALGYSDLDTRLYIAQCLSVQIFHVAKHGKQFDENRYNNDLRALPKPPFED